MIVCLPLLDKLLFISRTLLWALILEIAPLRLQNHLHLPLPLAVVATAATVKKPRHPIIPVAAAVEEDTAVAGVALATSPRI